MEGIKPKPSSLKDALKSKISAAGAVTKTAVKAPAQKLTEKIAPVKVKSVGTSLRINEDILEVLDQVAINEDRSRNYLINKFLREALTAAKLLK